MDYNQNLTNNSLMKKLIPFLILLLLISVDFQAQITGVKSYYKVSDTAGNFTGTLDNSDLFGLELEGIGDLNGDGIPDVAVNAYLDDDGYSDAGAVWILFLNLDGSVISHQKIANNTGGFGNELGAVDVFGNAIENIGDLNGDGVTDIAVGAMYDDDGGPGNQGRGAIYILFMNTDGTVDSYQKISATQGSFGGTLNAYAAFGTSIANLGDIDNDGIIDLAVGSWSDNDGGTKRGAIWILFMDNDGTVKSEQKISDGTGGFPADSLNNNDYFGYGVESLGDLDGDGVVDIIASAILDDDGNTNAGALWVLFLTDSGYVKSYQKISSTQGDFGTTLDANDIFGFDNQYMGDIDGDGDINVLVSARKDDDGGTDRGAVWILNLGSDGKVNTKYKISDTSSVFNGQLSNSDEFGIGLSLIGDLNNDGILEFGIGACFDDDGGTDRGAFYEMAFEGSVIENPLVKKVTKISDTAGDFSGTLDNSDQFGISVEGIGDLDGDGIEDLAVSGYQDDDGTTNAGAFWILFMTDSGTVKSHQKISNTDGGLGNILHYNEYFSSNIENLGDLDGDGVTDIAVSAQYSSNGGAGKGTVYILFLTDSGYVKSHVEIYQGSGGFTPTLDYYDYLGTSIANMGDLDGDGVIDLAVGAYGDDDGGSASGCVWILFMTDSGYVKSEQKISETYGNFLGALDANDYFGHGLENIGDLDGDGINDLLVGAQGDDDGGTDRGSLWVLFMTDSGYVKSEQKISSTSGNFNGVLDNSDAFGSYNSFLGDIDGDGYANIIVSASRDDDDGTDKGALWILNLKPDGTVHNYKKISAKQGGFTGSLDNSDYFGVSSALIGDLNNDGYPEIAVGSQLDDDGGTDRGAFYILTLDYSLNILKPYAVTKKKLDGSYYILETFLGDYLSFSYDEEYYTEGYLTFQVFNKDNQPLSTSKILPVNIGDNRFTLDMNLFSGVNSGEYYTLILTNNKGENRFLRFKTN